LKLLSFNARSIRNKWLEIESEINLIQPDVISISETWLKEDEADHYVIKEYIAFSQCRNNRAGGGVLLFIRASLDPLPVSIKYSGAKCNVKSA
jgi:exonuclease III